MSDPALSLVICTRDRADRLGDCLSAVSGVRSSRAWEVVVVDNASTDDTSGVVERARATFPVPLRLVEEPVPGVSRARNTGWRSASGAIVAYTDDDCYPAPDLVDVILARFERERELGFLGGAVLPHDPSDAPVTFVAIREPVQIRPGGFVTPGLLISANLAFRREVLKAIGGFDVAFGYGAGFAGGKVDAVIEDADAAARAAVVGWHGRYDPEAVVRHHHRRRPGSDVEAIRRAYDVGRGAFFAKCALDRRMRKTYLVGWLRLTAGRFRRREDLRPLGRELRGAAHYLAMRRRR
jgi:glycosyltransferase involved in cell wall biosynthesis